MASYTITAPPGVNGLYYNCPGVGRRKTRQYAAWIKCALKELMAQRARPIEGCAKISLSFPKSRHDIDARVKPSIDLLCRAGILKDDAPKYLTGISVNFHDDSPLMRIEISSTTSLKTKDSGG
jgi:Holliday junction resolvase RusA-like endonuclease